MKIVIKYLKSLAWFLGSLTVLIFILTLFNYFNIIGNGSLNLFKFITTILSGFIGAFYLGKRSKNKGWLEGIKIGLIISFLLFMISYLGFDIKIGMKVIIYYLVIIGSTTLGSMFGINFKRDN